MNPVIIVPKGQMSPENLKLLNDNDICTVEADSPALVKFCDPIPSMSSRTEMENAAIKLSRYLLSDKNTSSMRDRQNICQLYVHFLTQGTCLDQAGTVQEQEQAYFNQAKREELARLARIEAKEERAEAKAKKLAEGNKAKEKK